MVICRRTDVVSTCDNKNINSIKIYYIYLDTIKIL